MQTHASCLEHRGDPRKFSLGQPQLDWVLPGIYSPSKMPVSEFLVNAEDESALVDVAHGPSDATLISLVYKAGFLISSLDNLDLHPLTTRRIDGPSLRESAAVPSYDLAPPTTLYEPGSVPFHPSVRAPPIAPIQHDRASQKCRSRGRFLCRHCNGIPTFPAARAQLTIEDTERREGASEDRARDAPSASSSVMSPPINEDQRRADTSFVFAGPSCRASCKISRPSSGNSLHLGEPEKKMCISPSIRTSG